MPTPPSAPTSPAPRPAAAGRAEAAAAMLKTLPISSDRVSLALTEMGGHLSDVTFVLDEGHRVSPMHTAPWTHDEVAPETDPILRVLRGDFFCAPFGPNDAAA